MASTAPATPKCDGCGRRFPFRQDTNQRCQRCLKLQPHNKDSPEYRDIMMWKQCEGCGDVNEHVTTNHCDDCKDRVAVADVRPADSQPPSTQIPASNTYQTAYTPVLERQEISLEDEMAKQRALATQVRMAGHSRQTQPFAPSTQSNASIHTTPQAAPVSIVAAPAIKIWVLWESVLARSKKTSFAKSADVFSGDTTIPTVIEEILKKYINPKWTKAQTHDLEPTDLEVAWAKSMTLENGTASLGLLSFYNHYHGRSWTGTHRSATWKDHPAVKQNQKFVQLEIVINESMFKARTEAENINLRTTARTKRKRTNTLARETLQVSDRTSNLVNYALPPSAPEPRKLEFVMFNKLTCELNKDIFTPIHRWFKEPNKLHGQVSTTPVSQGAIKKTYELVIEGKKYAAKHVFAVDRAGQPPTRKENRKELMLEHVRLLLLGWALDQFFATAKDHDIQVATNIAVTDSFVIETDWEIEGQCDLIVEPFRSPSTRKFTSSLVHVAQGNSKIEQTIAAFTHFAFAKWNGTLVYADAQGSPSPVADQDGYVLFDPAFHSEEEVYGVADLGEEGIKSFTNTHICNAFCIRFAQVSNSMCDSMAFFPESGFEPPRKKVRQSARTSGEAERNMRSRSLRSYTEVEPEEDHNDDVAGGDEEQDQDDEVPALNDTSDQGSDDTTPEDETVAEELD